MLGLGMEICHSIHPSFLLTLQDKVQSCSKHQLGTASMVQLGGKHATCEHMCVRAQRTLYDKA